MAGKFDAFLDRDLSKGAEPAMAPAARPAPAPGGSKFDGVLSDLSPDPAPEFGAPNTDAPGTLGHIARATALEAAPVNPDAYRRALDIGQRLSVPADVAFRNMAELEPRAEFEAVANLLDTNERLAGWYAEADHAKRLSAPEVEALSTLDKLAASLKRGWLGVRDVVPVIASVSNARTLAQIDDVERRLAQGERPETMGDEGDPLGLRWMSADERAALRVETQRLDTANLAGVAARRAEAAALPTDPDVARALQAETFGEFWDAFTRKPLTFVALVGAESLANMLPALAGGVAGGVLSGGSPVGFAAGLGAGSFATDYGASVMDALQAEGVDIGDAAAIKAALADPERLERIRRRAFSHALVVGILDAASGGLGGRVGGAVATKAGETLAAKAMGAGAEVLAQGAMGAAGEAGGQVLSGQEVRAGAVAAEFFGEMAGAPLEAAGAVATGSRAPGSLGSDVPPLPKIVVDSLRGMERLGRVEAQAKATGLAAKDPALLRDFLSRSLGGEQTLYVDAAQLRTLFQSWNLADDPLALADELGIGEQMAEAVEAGGDVVIPADAYVAAAARVEGLHEAMAPYLRTAADGLAMSEVEAFEIAWREAKDRLAEEAREDADLDAMRAAPAERVYEAVREQAALAGVAPDQAEQYATLYRAFFRTMAERTGQDPMELFERYGFKVRRELPASLAAQPVDRMDLLLDDLRNGTRQKSNRQLFGATLLEYIANRGGVFDAGGELAAMDAKDWQRAAAFRRRLVRPDTMRGATDTPLPESEYELDAVARAAWEEGYLPGVDRPDINALLEAIRGELAGTPIYSAKVSSDPEADYRDAINSLDEVLGRLGLDVRSMDNASIKAALEQAMSANVDEGAMYQPAPAPDTPEFAAWFGDSKVVDADGKPLVVYKGMPLVNWRDGQPVEVIRSTNGPWAGFFSSSPEVASRFADAFRFTGTAGVVPAYVKIERPYVVDAGGRPARDFQFDNLNEGERNAEILDAIKGGDYDGVVIRGTSDEGDVFVPLKPEQVKSVFNRGTFDPADPRVLYQSRTGTERGSIQLAPGQTTINLFRNADLSTFLHESGHFFLEVMRDVATAPDAPAQVRADWDAIRAYLGLAEDGEIPVEAHETWARSFEAYLFEGKAPSEEVRGAFSRFRAWLLYVYRRLSALNVNLTDEVREVMGRMVATDEEMRAAEELNRASALFGDAAAAGMTEAEYAAYRATAEAAQEEARNEMERRVLAQVRREQEATYRARAEEVLAQVVAEFDRRPVYQAWQYLRSGKMPGGEQAVEVVHMRLDRDTLVREYGPAVLRRLPRAVPPIFTVKGGVHPDVVASMFGFGSGDEMVQALMSAPPYRQAVEAEVEARLRDEAGDPMGDPAAMAAAALEALHSDKRGQLLATELRALNRRAGKGKAALPNEAARNLARQMLARRTVKDATRVSAYAQAERRYAREAEKALMEGRFEDAAEAKRRQFLQYHLAREAMRAAEEVTKATKRFADLNRPEKAKSKTVDVDYLRAARFILSKFGLARQPSWDFAGWLAQLREADPATADMLQVSAEAAAARGKPYREMTLEEFRGLSDAVGNLLAVGKSVRSFTVAGERVAFETAVAELEAVASSRDTGARAGRAQAVTARERFKATLMGWRAALTRVEGWARNMDGTAASAVGGGPFTRYLVRPVFDAVYRYRDAKAERLGQLLAIIEPHKERLLGKRVSAPEIGYTFENKGELLHALLHTGNDSNMDKLLDGRGWRAGWQAMVARMQADGTLVKEDYDLAQAIWDLMEETKGPAQKAHRDMLGYYFDEVTAREVQTPWGKYRGGYVPAVADRALIEEGNLRADQEALSGAPNAAMFPTTGRGFTKGRVDNYRKPLELNLMLLPAHLDKVVRFTHLEPAIRAAGRLVNNRKFREAMYGADPMAVPEMLVPWLQRTARQSAETPLAGQAWRDANRFFRAARRNSSLQAMALNVINALQNLTGVFPAMLEVPPRRLLSSLVRFATNPAAARRDIAGKSRFMAQRFSDETILLQREVEEAMVGVSTLDKLRDVAVRHGYVLQRVTQDNLDAVVWMGAYDRALGSGLAEDEAVFQADSAVRRATADMAPESVSRAETGPAVLRLFTMFYGYFNAQGNLLANAAATALREIGWKRGAGRLLYLYLFGVMAPAVTAELIRQAITGGLGGEEGDDDDAAWAAELFLGSQLKYVNAMVPFVGQLTNALVGKWTDNAYDDKLSLSPVVSSVERAMGAPVAAAAAATGDGSPGKAVRDGLFTVGLATGLPLGQAGKPLGYLADLAAGEQTADDAGQVFRGLVTGRAEPPPR